MAMPYSTKFQLARAGTALGVGAGFLCLYRLLPNAMGGNSPAVRFWAIALFSVIVITIPIAIMYRYYQERRFDTKTQQQIAVETLAQLAKTTQPPHEQQPIDHQNQPKHEA